MPIGSQVEPSGSTTTIGHGEIARRDERGVAAHWPPEPLHQDLAQVAAEDEQELGHVLAAQPLLAEPLDVQVHTSSRLPGEKSRASSYSSRATSTASRAWSAAFSGLAG